MPTPAVVVATVMTVGMTVVAVVMAVMTDVGRAGRGLREARRGGELGTERADQ
jgi:hypothetical protein